MFTQSLISYKDVMHMHSDILNISIATSHRGLSMSSLLLEVETLVSSNLIRLDSQNQKPQNQFRKFIFKILFL